MPISWRSTRRSSGWRSRIRERHSVVELRFFGGLSMDEAAQALGVSLRTVHNDWAFARAWLYRALTGGAA